MSPRVPQDAPPTENPAQVMEAYGITRVPVDYFHWNGYRYTALKDAVAAARRAEARGTADA